VKPAPILFQIGGLALLIAVAVQAISVAVVLMTPPPAPPRMSPATMRDALVDASIAQAQGWRRTFSDRAPFASSPGTGGMIAASIATDLNRQVEDVRVRTAQVTGAGDGYTSVSVMSRRIDAWGVGFSLGPATADKIDVDRLTAAVTLLPQFTLPAFEAALRGEDGRWVVVGPPDHQWLRWLLRLGLMLSLSLLVLGPLVWWAARRLTLPVRALADAAGRANLGARDAAFPAAGPREVIAVAEALTAMRDRLTAQVDERMRILAAVAHDLRTPLTGLRLRAETAPPGERDRMAADIARMEGMIADVLAFSTASQRLAQAQVFDLELLCVECADDAGARGGLVNRHALASALIQADPSRVRRVIVNLIDNAVRYAGAVDLSLEVHGGRAFVSVADRGPGLSAEQIDAAFKPFYRLEPSRNQYTGGVGLGLTIARDLARADGGEVILALRDGGGLNATVAYPIVRKSAAMTN